MSRQTRHTEVGLTDLRTGEILDLTPLKNPPRKPVRARTRRSKPRNDRTPDSAWFVALLALLVASIAITQ